MGIGIGNRLPWKLAGDLKYFSKVTFGDAILAASGKMNVVIMGRKTWESLPEKHRPLKGRYNIVLSRSALEEPTGGEWGALVLDKLNVVNSLEGALVLIERSPNVGGVFVIGGANVYAQAIAHPDADKIYLTEIEGEFNCDAFFPPIPPETFEKKTVSEMHEENGIRYRFAEFTRK